MKYQFRRYHPPFEKSHTESLHCGRVSNAYERHSPQDIQGIFASWTGLVSPESGEECNGIPLLSQELEELAHVGWGWLSEGGPKLFGTSIDKWQ